MVGERSNDNRHRGMQTPAQINFDNLSNKMVASMQHLIDKRLSGYQFVPRDKNGGPRGGQGGYRNGGGNKNRTKHPHRGKGKNNDQHDGSDE